MFKKIACAVSLVMLAGCGLTTPFGTMFGSGGSLSADGTKGPRNGGYDWTVFVYMAADNTLSSAAPSDLNEMEAGLSSDRVRFVVLADQDQQGDSRILDIKHDPNGLDDTLVSPVVNDKGAVIPTNHEVDTGNPKTLQRFVEWGVKNYPSRRSMLVMWNHGGGAFTDPQHLKSFCWDDTSNSHLNLVDLWRSAQDIATKEKFDVIGFDTCLLGHLETAYQMKNLSSFLVSSEKVEQGDGWDYQGLAKALSLKPDIYPREFSAEIVKSFSAFYKKQGNQESTLSAIDLEKLRERLVPAVNDLAVDLQAGLSNPSFHAALAEVLSQTVKLTNFSGEEDSIDMGLFASMLQKSGLPSKTRTLAARVSEELKRATVLNLTTGVQAGSYTGLKLYFSEQYNAAYEDPSHQFFGTAAWSKFVKAYSGK